MIKSRLSAPCAASCALLLLAVAPSYGCTGTANPDEQTATQLPANASVTVYPIVMGGRPSADAAWAVGLMLEQSGLTNIDIAEDPFRTVGIDDPGEQAEAFARFVKKHPPETDYALFASYLGSPKKGVAEVRGVLANTAGKIVWSDVQGPEDSAFRRDKPRNPMTCSLFLVQRLREPLQLEDSTHRDAPDGQLAARYKARCGIPEPTEFDAMKKRLAHLRELAPGATVAVYPVRVGKEYSKADAKALVDAINERGLVKASLADTPVEFEARRSANQQIVLWSGANSIQKQLRKRAPKTDYALFAQYGVGRKGGPARLVHLFVLERDGDFVVVDFQNSHHPDFRRIGPKTRQDCTRLATVRLASYLD